MLKYEISLVIWAGFNNFETWLDFLVLAELLISRYSLFFALNLALCASCLNFLTSCKLLRGKVIPNQAFVIQGLLLLLCGIGNFPVSSASAQVMNSGNTLIQGPVKMLLLLLGVIFLEFETDLRDLLERSGTSSVEPLALTAVISNVLVIFALKSSFHQQGRDYLSLAFSLSFELLLMH